MDEEKRLSLSKSDDGIDKSVQSEEPKPPIDEKPKKLLHASSAPIRINVQINPSLETIGALCELETAETGDSDDENHLNDRPDYNPESLEELILLEHNYCAGIIYSSKREKNKQGIIDEDNIASNPEEVETQECRSFSMKEKTAVNVPPPVRRSKRQIEKQERESTGKDPAADDALQPEVKVLPNIKDQNDLFEPLNNLISKINESEPEDFCPKNLANVLQPEIKVLPKIKDQNNLIEPVNNLISKIDDSESKDYCSNYKSFADFKKRHLKIVIEDCRRNSHNLGSSNASVHSSNEFQETDCDFVSNENELKLDKESSSENSNTGLNKEISAKTKLNKIEDVTEVVVNRPSLRKRKLLKSDIEDNIVSPPKCNKKKNVKDVKRSCPKHIFVEKSDESGNKHKEDGLIVKRPKCSSMSSDNSGSENTVILKGSPHKRKKSVSFSDELILNEQDIPEKRQTLIDNEVSLQKSIPPTKISSITKSQKKKVARRDSVRIAVNENEPPLFSQPDVMVKVKSDDTVKKEEKESGQSLLDPQYFDQKKIDISSKSTNQYSDESAPDQESTLGQNVSIPVNTVHDQSVIPQSLNIELNESNLELFESTPDTLIKAQTICKEDNKVIFIDLEQENSLNSISSECLQDADNKEQDMLGNVSKQDSNVDESSNDSNFKDKVSAEEVSTRKTFKPERKSLRIIKKKEFFEDAVDAIENKKTPRSRDLKQNSETQNTDDKSLGYRNRLLNTTKKEKRNKDSDIDMDTDLDESEEDDPNKLWCICRKPHNARFMIQCDKCEEWFHGTCVGVTKAFGRQLEKLKKEWWCPNCRTSGQSVSGTIEVVSEIKKGSLEEDKDLKSDSQHSSNLANELISDNKASESAIDLKCDTKPKESATEANELNIKSIHFNTTPLETDVKPRESDVKPRKSVVSPKVSATKPKVSPTKPKVSPAEPKVSPTKPKESKANQRESAIKPIEPDTNQREADIKARDFTNKTSQSFAIESRESANKPTESTIKQREFDVKPRQIVTLKKNNFEPFLNIISDKECVSKYSEKVIYPSNAEKINKNLKLKSFGSVSQKKDADIETSNNSNLNVIKKRSSVPPKDEAQHKFCNSNSKNQLVTLKQAATSKSNSPNKAFQRIAIKQTSLLPSNKIIKEKGTDVKKQSCVQCQLPAKVNSCFCSDKCIDKHVALCLKSMSQTKDTLKGSDLDSKRLVVFDRLKGKVITNGPTAKEIASWLKANPSFTIVFTPSTKKETVLQKKDCDSSTEKKDGTDEAAKATVRLNVRKTLKNILTDRCKNADDIELPEEDIQRIANKIEEELHSLFKDNSFKYRAKYRSLMFNIKDPRNQGLFRKILKGNIPPNRLVCMSSEELASMELAKWREQENQHLLDLIKREQLEHQKTGGGLQLKKTHKGEVEIEDDLTSIIEKDVPKVIPKDIAEELVESEKEEEVKNTTHLHRSHLFDLNCKICTGKIVPPPVDESISKKVRVAHSISVDHHSPNASDSVERTVSRIVEGKSPVSSTGEDSMDQVPTSTVSIGSPEINIKYSSKDFPSKSATSVWKGFIFMQDIAKFLTSAYKVSGKTELLRVDLPDTIQVCGRIIPDQVWDYIGKIKQSGNKELIIIHFQPANEEEAVTYHSFYSYLSSRKRYGVVSNYSKKIKDFYLLPLAATSPVPMVLVPFDGPGLPSPRPHLLLGVIVRHKFKQPPPTTSAKQALVSKLEVSKKGKSCSPPRSYTPPLPTSVDESPKQEIIDVGDSPIEFERLSKLEKSHSITLKMDEISTLNKVSECINLSPGEQPFDSDVFSSVKDEDKPYDPEQDVLNLTSDTSTIDANIETPEKGSDNLEQHKKILDALTRQVEETDRQVNALKQLISVPEEETIIQSPNVSIDISSVAETGMSSFLDLPQNLQELLNSVRLKSCGEAKDIHKKGDVDMRITDLFGQQFNSPTDDKIPPSKLKGSEDLKPKPIEINLVQSEEEYISQAATPPPNEENDKPSVACPSDPRIKLRTSFHSSFTTNDPSKVMSTSEHTEHTQRQFMEEKSRGYHLFLQESKKIGSFATTSNWSSAKEPPPPGVESSELSMPLNRNNSIQTMSSNIVPTHYNSNFVQSSPHQINAVVPQQTSSFPTHLPHGFSVHTPPPTIQHFPPPIISTPFLPPPLQGSEMKVQEPWPVIQHSSYESKSGDWGNETPHWDNFEEQETRQGPFRHYSSEKSDFYREHFYERSPINQHEKQGYTRGRWNTQHQRGSRFENQRRGRGSSFRRSQRN